MGNEIMKLARKRNEIKLEKEKTENKKTILLPGNDNPVSVEYTTLPISLIDENPDNRALYGDYDTDAYAEVIKESGFVNFIFVYPKEDGRYEMISGHRSMEAVSKAGLTEIGAIITAPPADEIERRRNLTGRNYNNRKYTPLKTANEIAYDYETESMACRKLGMDDKDIEKEVLEKLANKRGISISQIKRYLQMSKLIPELKNLLDTDLYPSSTMAGAADLTETQQKQLYEQILAQQRLGGSDAITKKWLDNEISEFKYVKKFTSTANTFNRSWGLDKKTIDNIMTKERDASNNGENKKQAKNRRKDGAVGIQKSADLLKVSLGEKSFIKSSLQKSVNNTLREMRDIIDEYLKKTEES